MAHSSVCGQSSVVCMYLVSYQSIVDCLNLNHGLGAQRWENGSLHILVDLSRSLCPGDRARDRIEHEDPPQRDLSQRCALRNDGFQLLDGFQSRLQIDARECFSHVERLALTVEVSVIVLWKLRLRGYLACKETACQRNTDYYSNFPLLCCGKEICGGLQSEHVEDDLHALEIRVFCGLERLGDLLDADPIVSHLAFTFQFIKRSENFRPIVDLGGRAVQLQQVNAVYTQVSEASIHKSLKVASVISVGGVR